MIENPNFKKLKGKSVLVTGGAGFIGSNLCEILLEIGAKVTCLDNLSTGFRHNIQPFLAHENFTFLEEDIRDLEVCLSACENQDYVLHQAALGSVPRSIKNPIATNEVNIGGFLNMISAAKEKGIKRFIYAASSSTYGDSERLPKIEEEIGKPLSPYAITKYVNELYADVFHKTYGLNAIGLRYFNVYGRRQDPNGAYAAVIPLFVKLFMEHKSPTVNGDGSFSRDFTYIDNVLQMNLLALTTENEDALNQVYNTAIGKRTTLNELALLIQKELEQFDKKIKEVSIKHGPNRLGDIPHSLASIEKAKRLLGYTPTYNIEKGIKEAISWYWENL